MGMLLRSSRIVYLTYLNNVFNFPFICKITPKSDCFPLNFRIYGCTLLGLFGFMVQIFCNFPDLWASFFEIFRIYRGRLVLDIEWQNPVSPSTKLPSELQSFSKGLVQKSLHVKFEGLNQIAKYH